MTVEGGSVPIVSMYWSTALLRSPLAYKWSAYSRWISLRTARPIPRALASASAVEYRCFRYISCSFAFQGRSTSDTSRPSCVSSRRRSAQGTAHLTRAPNSIEAPMYLLARSYSWTTCCLAEAATSGSPTAGAEPAPSAVASGPSAPPPPLPSAPLLPKSSRD